jgi:DNA primase small subunit
VSERELKLIIKLVRSYYADAGHTLSLPSDLPHRELAFSFFERDEVLRHVAFKSLEDLRVFLTSQAPRHVFYSSAYYLSPSERDMASKGWMGADLVFDIDSDHIPTPCKDEHDRWTCLDCKATGRGLAPLSCPSCGGRRLSSESFYLCPRCLEAAKAELLKLIEGFLIPDFGFSPSELHVAFSGRRGYHLHVESEAVKELDQYARREIVDYLKAVSLRPEAHGFHSFVERSHAPPSLNHPGWRGRVARGVYSFLSSATIADLERLLPTSKRQLAAEIYASKERLLASLELPKPKWGLMLKYGRRFWERLVLKAIELQRCEIDERVTTDIHRLIRLPSSIHGDTGLIAQPLKLNDLDSFDPLKDAVAFKKGELRVHVGKCPQLTLMGECFGPFNDEFVVLPTAVAFYLLRSGLARLA